MLVKTNSRIILSHLFLKKKNQMQDSIIDNQIENYPRSTIVLYLNICLLLQHRLNEPICFVVFCHIVFHVGNHITLFLLVGLLTHL